MRSHLGRRKNLLMKLAFTIIVAVALASITTVAEATNSSASNQVSTPHDLGNRTKLPQRKKLPTTPHHADHLKQHEAAAGRRIIITRRTTLVTTDDVTVHVVLEDGCDNINAVDHRRLRLAL